MGWHICLLPEPVHISRSSYVILLVCKKTDSGHSKQGRRAAYSISLGEIWPSNI